MSVDGGVALVVDVDGSLTPADLSLESFVRFGRTSVVNFLLLLFWLTKGRGYAKAMVARRMPIDAATLPLRPEVLALIEAARAEGRPVILASASHARNIHRIGALHRHFDRTIGSSARSNIKGRHKVAALRRHIGEGAFDYVGDSRADAAVWREARHGYSLRHVPRGSANVTRIGAAAKPLWRGLIKSMRPQQWAKNALVFLPLLTSGLLFNATDAARALLTAILFSFGASGIYQINDVLDIDADRAHATKRNRPLPAGDLSIPQAILLAAALMVGSALIGLVVLGPAVAAVLVGYMSLSAAYSFRLKAAMTLDVITLACLYTIRIFAGAVAIAVALSSWLLLFSIFFFLSLAYLKRYTELAQTEPGKKVRGRGYLESDIQIVSVSGIAAGMVSILVLALFIDDMSKASVYATPGLLGVLPLCLLYWINRIWMMARRGEVDGDPVAFAMKDRRSVVVAVAMAAAMIVARFVPL
jgi:4-hydroxybenzoate polyprenyltransferase